MVDKRVDEMAAKTAALSVIKTVAAMVVEKVDK